MMLHNKQIFLFGEEADMSAIPSGTSGLLIVVPASALSTFPVGMVGLVEMLLLMVLWDSCGYGGIFFDVPEANVHNMSQTTNVLMSALSFGLDS
jgi:hypothetical protein